MAVNVLVMRRRLIASQPHLETVSGAVATFIGERFPLKSCKASIEPVQAGSGEPSPENVRPITGWTGAKVAVSPTTDEADGTTYSITFPTEAGTVYGGSLDVTNGVLTVDRVMYKFTGNENNVQQTSRVAIKLPFNAASIEAGWCSDFAVDGTSVYNYVYVRTALTADELKEYMQTHDVYAVLYIVTPITYQLTPQEITTLIGTNNVWADTGDVSVTYWKH